jgi:hypothetical protein
MGERIMGISKNSGSGYGDGYGYGSGYGDGSGDGYGDGYGSGDGYGDGDTVLFIPQKHAWPAYHYIKKSKGKRFLLRDGRNIRLNQVASEPKIKMCEYGLHAGLTKRDAGQYAPAHSVLTKVLVWGKVIVGRDKLVATHRKIIEEVK